MPERKQEERKNDEKGERPGRKNVFRPSGNLASSRGEATSRREPSDSRSQEPSRSRGMRGQRCRSRSTRTPADSRERIQSDSRERRSRCRGDSRGRRSRSRWDSRERSARNQSRSRGVPLRLVACPKQHNCPPPASAKGQKGKGKQKKGQGKQGGPQLRIAEKQACDPNLIVQQLAVSPVARAEDLE